MKQAQFKNMAKCSIGGRAAGEEFFLNTFDEDPTLPVEQFWRKRIDDGSVQIIPPTAPAAIDGKAAKK